MGAILLVTTLLKVFCLYFVVGGNVGGPLPGPNTHNVQCSEPLHILDRLNMCSKLNTPDEPVVARRLMALRRRWQEVLAGTTELVNACPGAGESSDMVGSALWTWRRLAGTPTV